MKIGARMRESTADGTLEVARLSHEILEGGMRLELTLASKLKAIATHDTVSEGLVSP